MKTLILMRHAKAEPGDFDTKDFDRKLSEKGKNDADIAAKVLIKYLPNIDLIVSSSAKRTLKTAKIIALNFGIDKENIESTEYLYESDVEPYIHLIRNLNNEKVNKVLIVGHNPTIGGMASVLSSYQVPEFKPGAFAVFQLPLETWKLFKLTEFKLLHQFTP